jgi:hypothetical protein
MNNRRLLYASIAGAFFTLTPVLIQGGTESPTWRTAAGIFMAPGALVTVALAGGAVHELAWQVILVVNFVFFSGVAYLILTVRERLRNKARDQKPSAGKTDAAQASDPESS